MRSGSGLARCDGRRFILESHHLQKWPPARITVDVAQEHLRLHFDQAWVALLVGALQPIERLVPIARISVGPCDLIRGAGGVLADELLQRGLRFAPVSTRMLAHRETEQT